MAYGTSECGDTAQTRGGVPRSVKEPKRVVGAFALAILGAVACGCSKSDEGGVVVTGADFSMTTPEFSLEPGEERYVCYTQPVDETLHFGEFSIADTPAVHHMFFARTLAPEPQGE